MDLAVIFPLFLAFGPQAELCRFPGSEEATRQYRLYEAHLKWLEQARPLYPLLSRDFDRWQEQAREASACWDLLVQAWSCHRYRWGGTDESLIETLASLRRLLGPDAYARGQMPPAWPAGHEPLIRPMPPAPDNPE